MANVEIHDLITAENISASDVISEQRNDGGTWLTRKLTFNNLGLFLNKILNYASDLDTTDKTIIGAINEVAGKKLTATLTAGSTSLTFTDSAITTDSLISVFTEGGLLFNSISTAVGSVVLTFDEQATDVAVAIIVR